MANLIISLLSYQLEYNLNNVIEVTSKPVLFDADNGGRPEHLSYTIRNLERLGVSAAMEDKVDLKATLFKDQTKANQDSIKNLVTKSKSRAVLEDQKIF